MRYPQPPSLPEGGTPAERLDAVDWGYETAFEVASGNPVGDVSKSIMDTARFGLK